MLSCSYSRSCRSGPWRESRSTLLLPLRYWVSSRTFAAHWAFLCLVFYATRVQIFFLLLYLSWSVVPLQIHLLHFLSSIQCLDILSIVLVCSCLSTLMMYLDASIRCDWSLEVLGMLLLLFLFHEGVCLYMLVRFWFWICLDSILIFVWVRTSTNFHGRCSSVSSCIPLSVFLFVLLSVHSILFEYLKYTTYVLTATFLLANLSVGFPSL